MLGLGGRLLLLLVVRVVLYGHARLGMQSIVYIQNTLNYTNNGYALWAARVNVNTKNVNLPTERHKQQMQ